jgi:hypothetical protein
MSKTGINYNVGDFINGTCAIRDQKLLVVSEIRFTLFAKFVQNFYYVNSRRTSF